ncbi:hypothetical protein [Aeromicrobium chenweiae]|uniref:Uncharacterized protein n=1 Tax=Aeromicrobium chenweiae TaxID=2079793 RepID=A0A2S0WNU1_9ACTN|nr:hypothetical protein [Aeromicrobium chenweiae]AWB92914.1 hypothetical protein C3E78_12260 [Aeromicrobium chenweiae]TGN33909.1 hypothetical protein E4L97_02310 [Aeromicrobium chenweiae]
MGIDIEPGSVLNAWRIGRQAEADLDDAVTQTTAASGTGLAGLQSTMTAAARTVAEVLAVAAAVVDETTSTIDGCLAEYAASDGRSAGRFHGLR